MREIDFQERESRRSELDRFKREIDLRQFATSIGYVQVQHSGRYWRGRRADKDEIVVTRTADGVWVYANPRDVSKPKATLGAGERPGDQGTVIDLLQRERPEVARNLGNVRKELRRWTGCCPAPSSPPLAPPRRVARAELLSDVKRADRTGRSAYLGERGLRPETLTDPRFIGSFGVRPWGEVIFPHRDEQGISGYERKHTSFTRFSTGGRRAVWHSNLRVDDRRLVIGESAIDCLSFHQLNARHDARYMSTAGTLSGAQELLLGKAIERMPAGGAIVIATDADEAGRKLASRIAAIAADRNPAVTVELPVPPFGKDWNDTVRERERGFIQILTSQRHTRRF